MGVVGFGVGAILVLSRILVRDDNVSTATHQVKSAED
jgi:hypothetical protein